MPTTIAWPPGRIRAQASRIVSARPTTSIAWSKPPGRWRARAERCPLRLDTSTSRLPRGHAHAAACPGRGRWRSPPGAGQARAGHDLQADTAAADHRHASPGCTRAAFRTAPSPVTTPQPTSAACQSGSDAGRGTAEAAGYDAALGEAGHAQEVLDRGAVRKRQASGAVTSTPGPLWSPAGSHRFAWPARHRAQTPHDGTKQKPTRSPGATWAHCSSHLLHDAGSLMPEDDRLAGGAEVPVSQVHVGVAHARRRHAYEHLVLARRRQLELLDADRRTHFPQNCRV